MALDGWTRIGDSIQGTGHWVVYRHRGRATSYVESVEDLPAEEAEKALRLYTKRAQTVGRGGLWLVNPQGVVCAATFIRP